MILYHGSNIQFDSISLRVAKDKRDFGKGFYTTTIQEQAREWAIIINRRQGTGSAFLYEFECADFNELNVKFFETEYTKEWLDFVAGNRVKSGIYHDFDIVKGPVADDRTRETLGLYLLGTFDAEYALKRLSYSKVNDQISFHTEKALNKLKLVRRNEWKI
jgi:hypothetical protein